MDALIGPSRLASLSHVAYLREMHAHMVNRLIHASRNRCSGISLVSPLGTQCAPHRQVPFSSCRSTGLLHEHPAVAFQILDAIQAAVRSILGRG